MRLVAHLLQQMDEPYEVNISTHLPDIEYFDDDVQLGNIFFYKCIGFRSSLVTVHTTLSRFFSPVYLGSRVFEMVVFV